VIIYIDAQLHVFVHAFICSLHAWVSLCAVEDFNSDWVHM